MSNYPAIMFSVLFICGIILNRFISADIVYLYVLFVLAVICFFLLIKYNYRLLNVLSTVTFVVLIIGIGFFMAESKYSDIQMLNQNIYKQKNISIYGKVEKINLRREYEISFELLADSIKMPDEVLRGKYKFLCKVRDETEILDSLYQMIFPGFYVEVKGTYTKGREKRNPGEYDYNLYLNSKNISGLVTTYTADGFKIISEDKNPVTASTFSIRKSIDRQFFSFHDHSTAGLLRGLLLADRSEISYQTKTEFINSGVIHVLAVSGLHVGFIALIFFILFGRFNFYIRSAATAVGLLFFMIITGMPPSVFRATIMALVIIIAFVTNRSTHIFNSLAIAAVIILLVDPDEIYNPGFQLSFSAVAAIGGLYPYFERRISKLRITNSLLKNILLFVALSFSAQIGTLPFTLLYFGKLSIVALLVNIVVIPSIGFIVGIGILTLILSYLLPTVAAYFALTNDLLVSLLFGVVRYTGNLEFSFLWVRQFSVIDSVIFYLILFFFCFYFLRFRSVMAKALLLCMCIISFLLFSSFDNKEFFHKNKLNIFAVDVGQGDAILIVFPNGVTALIDAGNATPFIDNGERVILPLLNHLNIRKIDYGFISNLDADHYGGFISLVYHDRIEQMVKPRFDSTLAKDMRLEKYLKQMGIKISYYENGFYDVGNVRIYTLYDEDDDVYAAFSTNDKSGVLRIQYGNKSFLFTGDIERKAEIYYSQRYNHFLKTNLLKVAHHGSKTSTIPDFVGYARPEISLISAGIQNKFGHPAEVVLDRLKEIKSSVYRTDELGAILFVSDGDTIEYVDWRR